MRALLRLLPLGLAAAFAAVVLAGCGSSVLDPVANAATKTVDVGSFRFTYSSSAAAGPSSASMSGMGAYDAPDHRWQMTLEASAPSSDGSMQTFSADMLVDASTGFVMYMRMPLLTSLLPQGKSWIRIDLEKAAKSKGVDMSQLLKATQAYPTQTLDVLKKVGS